MKTIYLEINEEITTIVGKIQNVKSHNIVLVVPKKAQLFQSVINLKILKRKTDALEKKVEIYTADQNGKALCKKLGIDLYEGSLTGINAAKSIQVMALPLQRSEKQESEKKLTITELIGNEQKKSKMQNLLSKPQTKKQKEDRQKWTKLFVLNTLRKKTTFAFVTASIVLLFLVSYIALPSATVYISPSSNVVEKTVNITLADREKRKDLLKEKNKNIIPSFIIETVFEQNLEYKTQGKVFTGNNAECELTITNNRDIAWQLIEQTRFQSSEGIVFRIVEAVTVPGAKYQAVTNENGIPSREKVPGTLAIRVTADETSADGSIVGAKGNLLPKTHFIIPGLTAVNQEIIYADNEKACSGGLTSSYSIVLEDDITAAKAKIQQMLSKGAKEYLHDFVEANNLQNKTNLMPFDDPQVIQEEVLAIIVPKDLVGQKLDAFTVNGKMKVRGMAYNREEYFSILDAELLEKVHPQKRLASIDRNSITYSIVYSDSDIADLSKVKLSVTVQGVEEYNFDPDSEQGKLVLEKILNFVPQKTVQESVFYISNLEEIQSANISVWPFWQKTIPGLKSSITIKVN